VNAALPNSLALNWESSSVAGGTPGRANSIARTNAAPVITDVTHAPLIPLSTDSVMISARVVDERSTGVVVTASYRIASVSSPGAFSTVPLFDDGAHNDGLAKDGIFTGMLPAMPNGTVVEFYLTATDADQQSRVYPKVIPLVSSPRTANLLYQVDNSTYSGDQPVYRMIMTEMEREEL
jgi:hypothetical protein